MADPTSPKPETKPGADAGTNPALLALRQRIDALDRELLEVLNRRMQVVVEVGELKKHEGSPVFRPEREAQVIDGLESGEARILFDPVTESVTLMTREQKLRT